MNKALIAKVGWRLIHDKESLWAKVIRKKYNVGEVTNSTWLFRKGDVSATWRSIKVGLCDVISRGITWVPRDGKSIRFWRDRWLMGKPLMEVVTRDVPVEELNKMVADLWVEGIGWDMRNITPFVQKHVYLRLGAVVLNGYFGDKDSLSWVGNKDGTFSVKSAYVLLCRGEEPHPCSGKLWNRNLKIVAPERVRTFLWLAVKQALMTNHERKRRHMAESDCCQVCRGASETILHVIRDCPAMTGIWSRLISVRRRREFFTMPLLEWIYDNLNSSERDADGNVWSTTFAISVWWGWKWRCMNVFGSSEKCRDRIRFIRDKASDITKAHDNLRVSNHAQQRVERMITWVRPEDDWVKINTDGASRGHLEHAAAGGDLRDGDGVWRGGFALNIGICTAPLAELWGVYYGLFIAWDRGFKKVVLEIDSSIVVGFLQTGISDAHPLSSLVRLCQGFFTRDWLVRVTHVYREANRLADGLANYAFSLPLGLHLFNLAPNVVSSIVVDDAEGSTYPRLVRL